MDKMTDSPSTALDWTPLYRAGGIAALLAGLLFRRNIAAEIALFSGQPSPTTVAGWFALLRDRPLLGLTSLNIFDVLNYALLALMFLALFVALWKLRPSLMALALPLALIGITVYLTSNTALSLLSLSDQYAGAATDAGRAPLLAAGQALLALNRFSGPDAQPGAGGYISLLLVAVASLLASIAMLRGDLFRKAIGIVGIVASALDLAYCLAYICLPSLDSQTLAVTFIPAAGLFWMIWHILVGWRLTRLGGSPA